MLQTPLGLQKTPSAKAKSQEQGGAECHRCKGSGHMQKDCPSEVAKKDPNWQKRDAEQKKKRCNKCGGTGHWGMHHANKKQPDDRSRVTTNDAAKPDCKFWMVDKCTRGNKCQFEHDPQKKG